MIIRSGFSPRGGIQRGFGLRPRILAGPRRFGFAGIRRGPFVGGYRRWGGYRGPGVRLAPWVHRPVGVGYRPWARGPYLRPGFFGARAPYYGRLAPWVRGRGYGGYATVPAYARYRPWIFRRGLPSWAGRFFPGISYAPGLPVLPPPLPVTLPIDVVPPPSPIVGVAPPEVAGAPPPPDAAASAPPDGAGGPSDASAGPADPGGPGGAPSAGPGAGAQGGGAPGGAPADGGAPPAGELPPTLFSEGKQVRIRWDGRARPVTQAIPPGGGVYVVYRDGKPETAHLTADFRGDVAKRFADELEAEGESEAGPHGQGEFFLRRWRYGGRGFGRRRRFLRFGRMGGMSRFGRMGRIRLLRSLRQRLMSQSQTQQEPEPSDDDSAGDQSQSAGGGE